MQFIRQFEAELVKVLNSQAEQMRRYSERPLDWWLVLILFVPLFTLMSFVILLTYLV